jgi:cytochrome P450 monooxygenase
MSETEFLQTVDEILFANLDVTSSILAFLLINLASNHTAQEELRGEILSYLPHGLDDSPEKFEAYVQKTDTLLEYTCMESIRLCPAAWFTLPEYATTDLVINGYKIKAGTFCIIDWARLNTKSPIWTPQKQEASQMITGKSFHPQRFRTMSPMQYRWSFLRFGLGGRQCLGKNFGGVIMKQFLVEVLSHYNLYMAGHRESSEKSGNIDVELQKDRFTVTPRQEVKFAKI